MTRKKKTRKTGPLAPSKAPKSPRDLKIDGKKKGKGKPSGARQTPKPSVKRAETPAANKPDARLGSKKPIPLEPIKTAAKDTEALSPQQQLQQLENDPRLQQLMEKDERGEILTAEEQRYVDEQSTRYEQLAAQLGIELDDDWDDEE